MIYCEPCIYPVGLCISKSIEELRKHYVAEDGSELEPRTEEERKGVTATTYKMNRRKGHGCAVGIVFWKKPVIDIIAHEAFHAADYIFNELGVDFVTDGSNEHWAYLIGWIAGCCGDFVKKEFKECEREIPLL